MCGDPEMNVTVCGMAQERYNALFDGALRGDEGELTEEELSQGWHFCSAFDGLLLHPEWDEEYIHCHCAGSVIRAFAKSCRKARRKQAERS